MTPFSTSASTTCAAGLFNLTVNSLKKGFVQDLRSVDAVQSVSQITGFLMIKRRELLYPRIAEQAHMDGEGETAQPAIRTNIRGRFFAADMLLARGKRQHETSVAIGIHGFAADPSRHLPHEFLAAGK